MRNAVLALGLVLASAGPIGAQAAWGDKLFLAKGITSHDFGTVARGTQLQHRFLIKNIYKVPLDITNIRVSCGCVTVKPKGYSEFVPATNLTAPVLSLKPNEESYLDINMDARRFTGHKMVSVYVTVGPQFISTATLQVTAVARQDVVFNPGSVDFGIVQAGQTPTQILEVAYSGNLPWRIEEVVKNASAPFKVKVEEVRREPPGRIGRAGRVGYRFEITLKDNAPPGAFKQEIILKTNDPNSPTLTVAVDGTVQASLMVTPKIVRMGSVKAGDNMEQRVIVSGSRPFRILGVDGLESGLTVEVANEAKTRHTLAIRYEPTKAGELHKLLLIRTYLNRESVTVTVDGNATKE
jgi:hypothetical protein